MVASLIVVLPNSFQGGALIVRHGAAKQTFSFDEAATGKLPCYAAFYADCEHEVQRVTHGVRLCLAYNLVRAVTAEAARRQRVDPGRISFVDAVRWLLSAAPGEAVPALVVNPLRPDRHEPRVIKDRQDSYRVMTKPRSELRKELKKQAVEA